MAISAIVASTACGRDRFVRRGQIISPFSLSDSILTPAQFVAGVPNTVTVTTWGHGGCVAPAYAEVTVSGLVATIEPFDYDDELDPDPTGLAVCNDIAPTLFHRVMVEFDAPGSATIVVVGLDPRGEAAIVERDVVVR